MSTYEGLFIAATAPQKGTLGGGGREVDIRVKLGNLLPIRSENVCVCVCLKEETTVVGGPRDRGFREESPLRLAGFITVLASHGKPTHRRKYRHT